MASPLDQYRQDAGDIVEKISRPSSTHSICDEKLSMTRNLLNLETGPVPWCLIEESSMPTESFVCYLTKVLTEEVQLYLVHNTGKEYWIKHVVFWNGLLDPKRHWWNTKEGLVYKENIRKLHSSLLWRWGNVTFIEYSAGSRAQELFVRACILFARKSTNKKQPQRR